MNAPTQINAVNTVATVVDHARRLQVDYPHLREGQTAYHALAQLVPAIANRVPWDVDPFYRDERLPQFWTFVATALEEI